MKRKITAIILLILVAMALLGCGEDKTILQSENDFYSYVYANVELIFNFQSVFGEQIIESNANAWPIGVYVADNNNPGLIVFSDNWTWSGNTQENHDVYFVQGQELKITVVVYNQLGIVAFPIISALGPNFLGQLSPDWYQDRHEEVIVLQ